MTKIQALRLATIPVFIFVIAVPLSRTRGAALIDLGIGLDEATYANIAASNLVEAKTNVAVPSVTTITPAAVSSDSDFNTYASSALSQDSHIKGVTYNPDDVVVWYQDEGKLLALIPITLEVKITAYPDGKVEVTYPWYSSITIDRKDELQSRLSVAVSTAIKTSGVGMVKAAQTPAKFSPAEAAVVTSKMLDVLKSNASADSSTLDSRASATSSSGE